MSSPLSSPRPAAPDVLDVDAPDFAVEVVERSHHQPVVVDFWAAWCGPCRTLGPLLTEAVEARAGEVRLAKVDVDANPGLAGQYGVQGIPAVKGFRDGRVVAEFTGAVPRTRIDSFLDQLVPSAADRLVARARAVAEADPDAAARACREALATDPGHGPAAIELARLVVEDDPEEAAALVRPHLPDPEAEAVAARARPRAGAAGDTATLQERVAADPADATGRLELGRLLVARGDHEAGAQHLLAAVRLGGEAREPARDHLVALFTALGGDHDLVRRLRPELARALY